MSDLSQSLCASVELLSQTIAWKPQPKFPQVSFHPNVIDQNLNRYYPIVSKQQGWYYAHLWGETTQS